MVKWIGCVVVAAVLAGCISREDRVAFDGEFFNARLRKVERQSDQFTVTVRPVSRSLVGAREAGRHAATIHCVSLFGSSDIIWSAGPDAAEGALNIDNDTLTLAGRCPADR